MSSILNTKVINIMNAIIGQKMVYQNQVDMIEKYEIKEERERVFFTFRRAGSVGRVFEGLDLFLKDMQQRIADYEHAPVAAPPSIFGSNISEETKTIVAYVGDNNPIDRCIASLMEDLDGLNSGEDIDEAKLKSKITIADHIVKLETAKVQKGAVVAKMMGGL